MYINEKTYVLAALQDKSERVNKIPDHEIRSNFQRDRDRILYSRAFRRLSGKTQVFLSVKDDHVRNRLTHTLEVNQIAQTISKALWLNTELTEAIALGHDLGHTPFGHVGERTLNHIMNGCYKVSDFNINIHKSKKGFKHNLQGVRVASELEEVTLNLTKETLWGIMNHSKLKYKSCERNNDIICNLKHNSFKNGVDCNNIPKYNLNLGFYDKYIKDLEDKKYWTIEALIVAMADEIAQRHHDIEDAIEFKILSIETLIKEIETRFKEVFRREDNKILDDINKASNDKYKSINLFSKLIVDFLTTDLIRNTEVNLEKLISDNGIKSNDYFYEIKESLYSKKLIKNLVSFSDEVKKVDEELQDFLCNRILNSFDAQRMDGVGQYVIRKLFEAYAYNPQQLRDKTIKHLYKKLYENILSYDRYERDYPNQDVMEYLSQFNEMKSLLQFDKFDSNKNDIGKIRDIISDIHYKVEKSQNFQYNLYNDTLLRVICDYIAGMTDKYALDEHRKLYNCGNIIL